MVNTGCTMVATMNTRLAPSPRKERSGSAAALLHAYPAPETLAHVGMLVQRLTVKRANLVVARL